MSYLKLDTKCTHLARILKKCLIFVEQKDSRSINIKKAVFTHGFPRKPKCCCRGIGQVGLPVTGTCNTTRQVRHDGHH